MIDLSKLITKEDKAQKSYERACEAARAERNKLLDATLERIQRYQLQIAGDLPTDEDASTFQELLEYAQSLRDVPHQPNFPQDIEWPDTP